MLERNINVKLAPEKFQHENEKQFDVIVTFETRVFDALVEHMSGIDSVSMKLVHVFGLHIKDNPEAALIGGQNTVDLLAELAQCDDWENELDRAIEEFQQKSGKQLLHAVFFY